MRGRGGGGKALLVSPRGSSRHEGGWENSRKLCKTLDCISGLRITLENSPNPASVQIRLYRYGKKFSIAFTKKILKINSTNEWKLCLLTS